MNRRYQRIAFKLFLWCFCTLPLPFFTQKCYGQLDEMAAYKGTTLPVEVLRMKLPQNLNPSTIDKIKEYVIKNQ